MDKSAELYQNFTKKMKGLEEFRRSYQTIYSTENLDQNDPELKRLTEALAFFSSHTEEIGNKKIHALHQRLIEQIHPYVCSPLPSKTIVCINPIKLKETTNIDAETVFQLETDEGEAALYKSCQAIKILPLNCTETIISEVGPNRVRVQLRFEAFQNMSETVGEFPIYLNMNNNFLQSLDLYHSLHNANTSLFISYDNGPSMQIEMIKKEMTFPIGMNPINQIRNRMHFPYLDLFIYPLLNKSPENWRSFTLSLTFNKSQLNHEIDKDCFRPFCVPLINLRKEMAKEIWADGLKSKFQINQTEIEENFKLHSLEGIYQRLEKRLFPIVPSFIKEGDNTFSLFVSDEDGPSVELNISDAYINPRAILIKALWHQPKFSDVLWKKISVSPYEIEIPGVEWSLTQERIRFSPSISQKEKSLVELLSLHTGDEINRNYLINLFYLFASELANEFKSIKDGFIDIHSTSTKNKFTIDIQVSDMERILVDQFISYFQNMINNWFHISDFKFIHVQGNNNG